MKLISSLLLSLGLLCMSCVNGTDAQSDPSVPGWRTNISKRSIDLSEIARGGPPKDGIPAIDRPQFVSVDGARRWLREREPVIALEVGEEARAYPLQILIWHEIVNDEVKGTPIAVTFCPLCHSALAFDRRIDDRTLTFGVSGLLRHSDMVMYDRQTESWWQQFTGEAIVGDLTEKKLKQLPAQIIGFAQFAGRGHAYTDEARLHELERMVERACEDRNEMLGFVKLSPELDGLRFDERFAAMLKGNRFFAMAA